MSDMSDSARRTTLQRAGRALKVIVHPPHLRRTGLVALLVGTWLTGINLGDALLSAPLTTALVFKVVMNYFTPFFVANLGLLSRG